MRDGRQGSEFDPININIGPEVTGRWRLFLFDLIGLREPILG
jgi:hypothetical protein